MVLGSLVKNECSIPTYSLHQVATATYLGQPCSLMLMQPVVGRYFGKKGQWLDKYGANLAATSLSRTRALHTAQSAAVSTPINDETLRNYSEKEAVNFLLEKFGEPYVNHVLSHQNARKAPHSNVPVIHARNFPVLWHQTIDHRGATSSAEAFCLGQNLHSLQKPLQK